MSWYLSVVKDNSSRSRVSLQLGLEHLRLKKYLSDRRQRENSATHWAPAKQHSPRKINYAGISKLPCHYIFVCAGLRKRICMLLGAGHFVVLKTVCRRNQTRSYQLQTLYKLFSPALYKLNLVKLPPSRSMFHIIPYWRRHTSTSYTMFFLDK